MADDRSPVDVDALMVGIRARVAEKKARGLYSVDALALDAADETTPWNHERLEALQASTAIVQHLVVASSDKGRIGPAVTRAKRAIVRAGFHNVEDVAGQVTRFNAEITSYVASLAGEVARLRNELDRLNAQMSGSGTLSDRVARLEASALDGRLARLERRVDAGPSATPDDASPAPAAAATDRRVTADVADLRRQDDDDVDVARVAAAVKGHATALVLNCGDGAMFDAFAGARGVDARPALADAGRAAGRDVTVGDPVDHLVHLDAGSVDALVVWHLVEQCDSDGLGRLMHEIGRVLAPTGTVAAVVRNPRCGLEMSSAFWRDPRRTRPVDPETVGILLQAAGILNVELSWAPPRAAPVPGLVGSGSTHCIVVGQR